MDTSNLTTVNQSYVSTVLHSEEASSSGSLTRTLLPLRDLGGMRRLSLSGALSSSIGVRLTLALNELLAEFEAGRSTKDWACIKEVAGDQAPPPKLTVPNLRE